jgi:hypothetical protein
MYGFVFWDRERVELFKRIKKMEVYRAGWLRNAWSRVIVAPVPRPAMILVDGEWKIDWSDDDDDGSSSDDDDNVEEDG